MKLNHLALALTVVLFALTGYLFYQGQLDRKRFADIEERVVEGERRQSAFGGRVENVERAVGIDPSEAAAAQMEREVLLVEREIIDRRIGELGGEGGEGGEGAAAAPGSGEDSGSSVAAVAGGESPGSLPPLEIAAGEGALAPGGDVGPPANLVQEGPVPGGGGSLDPEVRPPPPPVLPGGPDLTPMQRKVKNAGSIGAVEHYDPQWAFVVIGMGSEGGIEVGDRFAVRREHFVVASVEVSEVKEEQAIANLVPGTLEPGMEIRPGDEIIHNPLP